MADDQKESREIVIAGDALTELATGIPAPIRSNALKAFSRLFSAAVEIPAAWLEGVVEERRAETKARVKLIETSANQVAEQMRVDPEYARLAATKFAHKIVRERVNVDKISLIAAEELKSADTGSATMSASETTQQPEPISEDWLNAFENEAAQLSSEQMQQLFGKILAGEIRKPQSFSIRTIKLMAQLDNRAASLFRRFCSLSISLRVPDQILDARVTSMGSDLSPFFHPVGSRDRTSFEPCWLGGATGRGAEPRGSLSAPARCIPEAQKVAA